CDKYVWVFPDSGRMYAEEGLQLSKELGYKYGEGIFLFDLCVSLSQMGNFSGALDFGFKALSIFENLHDTANLIGSYVALMICYRDQGDYKQGLVQGYKAKELQELFPHSLPMAQTLLANISSIYEKDDELDSALYYGRKAYQLGSGSGILITLGNIYSKMGNQEMALDYYRNGINLAGPSQHNWSLMDIYNGMSKVFESTRRIDSSIHYAQNSFFTGEAIANPRGVLEASRQLAHLYELKGMYDSTVKYLKLTVTLNDSLFSRQKTREAQNFAFNEKLYHQEAKAEQLRERNRIKMYVLSGVVLVFLLIVFILWRNNTHKQKTNALLNQKNAQIQGTLAELKSTQSQLIQSEKMASLGELTAGIAHEIQNPLNFVNNFSEVNKELLIEMKDEMNNGNIDDAKSIANDVIENEEKINHHGKRADAIVKGMLQHSRSSNGKKELTDINALADEYLRLAYHGMRAKDKSFNTTTKTDFDDSIGKINVVPQDVGRVILNLLNNAFYAVDEKKKSPHPLKGREEYEPVVTVTTKRLGSPPSSGDGGKIEIRVADNGNGIAQKVLDKIFQPFFTTKPTGQGTGLGLSLSYDI
ncbi:MAG TPA: ATP-binding protein, partial [Chitinophagaceae bacterium]|nr:ATP-binding protein [Chitinophagaceae bacterium]